MSIDALGLTKIDLLGFSIGGMVAQQIVVDRPELIRKLILVGETIPMQQIETAFARMVKSDVKYRFVVDMQSLKQTE